MEREWENMGGNGYFSFPSKRSDSYYLPIIIILSNFSNGNISKLK